MPSSHVDYRDIQAVSRPYPSTIHARYYDFAEHKPDTVLHPDSCRTGEGVMHLLGQDQFLGYALALIPHAWNLDTKMPYDNRCYCQADFVGLQSQAGGLSDRQFAKLPIT